MVRMTAEVIRKTYAPSARGGKGAAWPRDTWRSSGRGTPPGCSRARWWAGCRTPPPRSRSCCSSAPRAARTAWPARSPRSTGVANAVGQPLLGRLVDLHGQPRVLLPGGAALGARHGASSPSSGTEPLPLGLRRDGASPGSSPRPWRAGCGRCGPRVLRRRGPGAHRVRHGRGGAGGHVHRRAAARDAVRVAVVGAGRAAGDRTSSGCWVRSPWSCRRPRARGARRRARRTGWARCARPGCWRCSGRSCSSGWRSARSRWRRSRTRTSTAATWCTAG